MTGPPRAGLVGNFTPRLKGASRGRTRASVLRRHFAGVAVSSDDTRDVAASISSRRPSRARGPGPEAPRDHSRRVEANPREARLALFARAPAAYGERTREPVLIARREVDRVRGTGVARRVDGRDDLRGVRRCLAASVSPVAVDACRRVVVEGAACVGRRSGGVGGSAGGGGERARCREGDADEPPGAAALVCPRAAAHGLSVREVAGRATACTESQESSDGSEKKGSHGVPREASGVPRGFMGTPASRDAGRRRVVCHLRHFDPNRGVFDSHFGTGFA